MDDGRAGPGVGEGLGPAPERLVRGYRNTVLFLPLRQNLDQHLGAAAVQFEVAELIKIPGVLWRLPKW